jgi:hypothetical protein
MTSSVSREEIDGWTGAVSQLHEASVAGGDAEVVRDAAARTWSEFGFQQAPAEVLTMLSQATEVGYARALRDLREGWLDDEVYARQQALED